MPVFNLTVEGDPEFFANGVLTHNCAMLRYGAMSRPEASDEPKNVPDDPRAEAVQRAFQGPDESVPWYERESQYADV